MGLGAISNNGNLVKKDTDTVGGTTTDTVQTGEDNQQKFDLRLYGGAQGAYRTTPADIKLWDSGLIGGAKFNYNNLTSDVFIKKGVTSSGLGASVSVKFPISDKYGFDVSAYTDYSRGNLPSNYHDYTIINEEKAEQAQQEIHALVSQGKSITNINLVSLNTADHYDFQDDNFTWGGNVDFYKSGKNYQLGVGLRVGKSAAWKYASSHLVKTPDEMREKCEQINVVPHVSFKATPTKNIGVSADLGYDLNNKSTIKGITGWLTATIQTNNLFGKKTKK